jgi:hypothetical protein
MTTRTVWARSCSDLKHLADIETHTAQCLLYRAMSAFGAKRTLFSQPEMSANDPHRTDRSGTKKAHGDLSIKLLRRNSAGAPREVLSKGNTMTFHVFFWAMCLVVTAYVTVAIIAIAKAYRNDRRVRIRSVTRRGFLS